MGKASWSQPHMRYLRELVLPHPAMKTMEQPRKPGERHGHTTPDVTREKRLWMILCRIQPHKVTDVG
jgi:hypothetical protein